MSGCNHLTHKTRQCIYRETFMPTGGAPGTACTRRVRTDATCPCRVGPEASLFRTDVGLSCSEPHQIKYRYKVAAEPFAQGVERHKEKEYRGWSHRTHHNQSSKGARCNGGAQRRIADHITLFLPSTPPPQERRKDKIQGTRATWK